MKMYFHRVLSVLFLLYQTANLLPCVPRDYPSGTVCVCNASYCDSLDDVGPERPGEFILVSSSKGGLRFLVSTGKVIPNEEPPKVLLRERRANTFTISIEVDRTKTYQKIYGFGGAFTGAVSYNLEKLSKELRHHIYRSYFSKKEGIGYSFIRLSIGGCDFDLRPWAYNENPNKDATLSNFTKLDARDEKKVEQLKDLMAVSSNFDIKYFGAAWSPPPWMKNNNAWTGLSWLKKEYYQTWADYHVKFIELMAAKNISIWAISTGNEPLNGIIAWMFVRFMSLGWIAEDQGRWVGRNLGPTIRKSNFKNVKLFSNDDQRYTFPWWFRAMERAEKGSTSYLDGLAVHWYWNDIISSSTMDRTHNLYKDKLIINTESCVGDKPWEKHGPELGSWSRAEKYFKSYLDDLRNWVNAWIDWNIVLDEQGGPNYVKNYVDSPIIVNTTSGEEIYKQPIFYAIGHFSKFITEESIRIWSSEPKSNIATVAFLRPDGNVVLIIFNGRDSTAELNIYDKLSGNIVINIPARSFHTIVYK